MRKTFFLSLLLIFSLVSSIIPQVYATTETRYMRNEQVSGNIYRLGTSQTESALTQSNGGYGSTWGEWGIRVWKNGTEITSGTPVAIVTHSGVLGEESATWDCPETSLDATDYVEVKVYCRSLGVGSWYQYAKYWQTEALGANQLDSATWTVYYWVRTYYNSFLETYTYYYHVGYASADSRITNFQWSSGAAPTNYVVDLTNTFSVTFNKLHQTGFSVPLTFAPTITFAKLIQSTFNVLLSFTPSIAFVLSVISGYFINLLFQPTISFSTLLNSTFNIILSFIPSISFIVLLQSTFNVLLTYATNITFDLLMSVAYIINLTFQPSTNFVLDIHEGLHYFVDLTFHPVISFLLDVSELLITRISIFFIGLLAFSAMVFLALVLTKEKKD